MDNQVCINCVKFFAVALPSEYDGEFKDPTERVFQNASEALSVAKKIKGSRFNSFPSHDAALAFASSGVTICESKTSIVGDSEKSSVGSYRTPPPRELGALRRSIEQGKLTEVEKIVRNNPRFLISSGDSAVVLMEGPRYNAAHVAAKADKSDILRLILTTVDDPDFVLLLYPSDQKNVTESRNRILLEYYLNTPDKGACDTPLHFACKFGSEKCVAVLLSYTECDLEKVNKQSKKASEVICERKGDATVKQRIQKLFEQRYFVPVIRTEEDVHILSPIEGYSSTNSKNLKSPAALAGPMTPEQADDLFKFLKSPGRKGIANSIKLSDHVKGVERVARTKCHEMGVPWAECWPFLDSSIDLASEEGLVSLEKHFSHLYTELNCRRSESLRTSPESNLSPLSSLCNRLEALNIESSGSSAGDGHSDGFHSDDDDTFSTAPSTPTYEVDFFVFGAEPNKWDQDAAIALQDTTVSSERFPFVANWFKRVSELKAVDVKMFTPKKPSTFTRNQRRLNFQ